MKNIINSQQKQTSEKLLTAIEKIAQFIEIEGNPICSKLVLRGKHQEKYIEVILASFDFEVEEAVIFSVLFYLQVKDSWNSTLKGVSEMTKIPIMEIYKMYHVFDGLNRKGVLSIEDSNREEIFRIKKSVFKQIIRLQVPEVEKENQTIFKLSQNIYKHIDNTRSSFGKRNEDLYFYLENELDDYSGLEELKTLEQTGLDFQEIIVFLYVVYCSEIESRTANITTVIESTCVDVSSLMAFRKSLMSGSSVLITKKLLKAERNSFMGSDSFAIGPYGLKLLELSTEDLDHVVFKTDVGKVIDPSEISKVDLFYNSEELVEINKLKKVLRPSNYNKCVAKLKSLELTSSFSTILYGEPGTGKTELVYQLSRITKRKVLSIDMSSIKDKYVGESEKRVSKIFDEYERLTKMEKNVPILLFNECDAILSKRITSHTSVDQMSNTMQNIFLQRLEDFTGIIVATSNLIENLDKAFERRFLLKLKIEKPSYENRVNILKKRFKGVGKDTIENLAYKFELTGAQIGNISKRWAMEKLFDDEIDSSRIEQLASQELLTSKEGKINTIGFIKK